MPRGSDRSRDRDREIANFWSRMIRAGLEARKKYTSTAKEVEEYLGHEHKSLFESAATRNHYMKFDGTSAVTVPKIAQMRNTLGPRLYQTKPVRTITPRTDDGVMLALSNVLEAYINYTVRETKFVKQLRRSIDDGIVRGRAYLAQGLDPVRDVVTSSYVSSLDVVFDPDFLDIDDAKWVAIRRVEPFWETKRRVTEKWRTRDLAKRVASDGQHLGSDSEDIKERKAVSTDLVTYWVILSKMGRGFRGMSEDKRRRNDDKDFVRLEIVLDHRVPIAEGDWDVPLYLDKEWPLSHVDLVEGIDRHYPDSIAAQVLGSQKAIDLISSLRMSSVKNRDRMIAFIDSAMLGKTQLHQFKHGTAADMIAVDVPTGKTLGDILMIPNFGEGSREAFMERQFHIQQIETTTGITDALHGGQEAQAKERSATASQIRSDAANARISDLKHRIEEFTTDSARKEALLVRLLLDVEDVDPIVRTSDIGMFYVSVEVPGGASVPVRNTDRENKGGGLTLEDLSPQASNFFPDPQAAFQSAQELWQEMLETDDPRVIELVQNLMVRGMNEEQQVPNAISVDVVTVETVWDATAGISPAELMREFSYELQTGSGNKITKEAEQANAQNLVQTALPTALQMGDVETANKIMKIRDDAFDVAEDNRVTFTPPPPPPEQQQGQAPQ